MELSDIQAQGATARLRRQHMVNNPFYWARHMPPRTGESLQQWYEKAAAWRQGWERKNSELTAWRVAS